MSITPEMVDLSEIKHLLDKLNADYRETSEIDKVFHWKQLLQGKSFETHRRFTSKEIQIVGKYML